MRVIVGLPNAAIRRGHVEDVRLLHNAANGDRAPAPKRADQTPVKLRKCLIAYRSGKGGQQGRERKNNGE